MRKKVFSGIFALVILLIAGYGVNKSMNSHVDLNDLALRNVLALADVENPDPGEGGSKTCLTDQKRTQRRIPCYASMVTAECYEFSCTGSGDYCIGATGFEYYCLGDFISTLTMGQKPC